MLVKLLCPHEKQLLSKEGYGQNGYVCFIYDIIFLLHTEIFSLYQNT